MGNDLQFQTPDPYYASYLVCLCSFTIFQLKYRGVRFDRDGVLVYRFDDPLRLCSDFFRDIFEVRDPVLSIRNYQAALTRLRFESKQLRFQQKQQKGVR